MNLKPLLTSLSLGFASLMVLLLIMNLGRPLPVVHAAGAAAPPKSVACPQTGAVCPSPAALGWSSPAAAPLRATVVVTISASKDNTMFSESGNLSLGAGKNIFAGKTDAINNEAVRRALIAFNLAGNVPAGAIIENVSLRLYLTLSPSGVSTNEDFHLHRLSADWGEGTSVERPSSAGGNGNTATNNDVTWTHRFSNTLTWATPGAVGQFVITPSATTSVGTVAQDDPPVLHTWSSPQMVADVQAWVNNPGQNFGWLLKTSEITPKVARRFASKEYTTAANRPVLVVTYSIPEPELAISKTASDRFPGAGEDVTYTIVVSNTGNAPATNVRIFDPEPVGIDFNTGSISVIPPGGTTNATGSQITISGLTIGPGQRVTTTFNATVNNDQGQGNLITNTATVTSAEIATPVGSSVRLNVTNLAIRKTASNPNPAPGEVVTFTVVVTNVAERDFSTAKISDPLPAGLSIGQITNLPDIVERFTNNTVVATSSIPLEPGATMTVIFSAIISDNLSTGDVITNIASVNSSININPVSASTVLVLSPPPPPSLALSKRVNTPTAKPGQRITYTVVITNSGLGPATGARIADNLPAGVTFAGPISLTPGGAGTVGTLPTLASNVRINAGATVTVTLPVTVNLGLADGTLINNTASITSNETPSPTSGSGAFTVVLPDLVVNKQVDDATPEAGQRITYTIVVANNGPVSAANGILSDNLPSQVTFAGPISLDPPGAGDIGTLPVLASNLSLASGEIITVTFPVTVNIGLPINTVVNNTASITSTETPNPSSGSRSFTVSPPVLTLEKRVDKPQAVPGSNLIYTIIVTNNGQGFATGGTLIDFLPSQVDFVGPLSLDPPGAGNLSSPPFLVTGLTITPGARIVVTVPVQIDASTPFNTVFNNTASINSNGVIRSDSVAVTVTPALLELVKEISNPRPLPGTVVTYTILVTNIGQVSQFNLAISDTIPNDLTLIPPITLDAPSFGTVGPPPQIAQVNSLFPGQSLKITFRAGVDIGLTPGTQIINRAEVDSNELFNPIIGSVGLVVGAPSMTLTKQIDTPFPVAGQTVTYTLRVINDGDATLTNVAVSDILPGGVTLGGPIGLEPPGAGITGLPPLVATIVSLAPGEIVTVTIPVEVGSGLAQGTVITNTANANSLLPLLSAADSVALTVATPGLTLTKQINNPLPIAGQQVTYTLRVTNTGNSLLTNLVVSDTLPANLTLVGPISLDPPGSGAPGNGGTLPTVATIPTLTAGSSLTVSIPVEVNAATPSGTVLTNTATVTTNFPLLLAQDVVTLAVAIPGLALTKRVDDPTPGAGAFVNYIIVLTNTGNALLTNLVISDTLPAEVTLAGSITLNPPAAGVPGDGGTLPTLATLPNLAPGSSVTVDVPVQISSVISEGTVITNTAEATSDEITNPVTDTVAVTITPPPIVGLDILKQVNKTNPQAGEIITYTIVVINVGQTTVTNMRVADTLPGGVTFLGPVRLTPPGVSLTPTLPTLASGLSLAAGGRLTLTFPVRVNPGIAAGTILTNTASVTGAQLVTPTTYAVAVTVAPSPVPVLALTKRVSNGAPQAGSIVTYTLNITNFGSVNATGMRISDTLPAGLTLAGPISLNPPGAGTPGNAGTLPTLASNVTLNAGQRLTLTFPVLVNTNLASGTLITNRASVTSAQVATPSTGQVTLRVISSTTPAAGRTYFPLILKTLPLFPDLVGSFSLTPNQTNFAAGSPVLITVVITNVGTAVADSFWVDFYINPSTTPRVNLPWNQTCSLSPCYGLAWFVPPGLDPGESVTLTSTPNSYSADHTVWPGSFASGTSDLYLYVDSWNPTVPTGGILESNENNNLFRGPGLTVTGLTVSEAGLPDPAQLPPRPAP